MRHIVRALAIFPGSRRVQSDKCEGKKAKWVQKRTGKLEERQNLLGSNMISRKGLKEWLTKKTIPSWLSVLTEALASYGALIQALAIH